MEELVRRILGYVEFYAEKGDFERFLTLCAKNEIRVWNVRKEEDGMYGCAAIYSYKAFTWLRRRTAVKTKILKKKAYHF